MLISNYNYFSSRYSTSWTSSTKVETSYIRPVYEYSDDLFDSCKTKEYFSRISEKERESDNEKFLDDLVTLLQYSGISYYKVSYNYNIYYSNNYICI
jgi:hypothetical protein